MRTVTTTFVVVLASLVLLGACGGDDGAAKAQKIKDLKAELKAVNAKKAELHPGWQEIRNLVIPARQAWLRAKGSPEESAAKDAFDKASADAQETIDAEKELDDKIREITDAIAKACG